MIQIPELLNPERFSLRSALCALRSAHCKGASPPAPAPPPVYEPPPPLTSPPAAPEPKPSPTEEQAQKDLTKQKEEIARKKKGRSGTILTGLLTEEPVTTKAALKEKLGG